MVRSGFETSIFEALFYYNYAHQLLVQDLLKYIEILDMLVVFFKETHYCVVDDRRGDTIRIFIG